MLILFCFLLHALALLPLGRLLVSALPENRRGMVAWLLWVSIFLPLIGELLGLIVWLAEKKSRACSALTTYDDYVRTDVTNYENLIEQATNDARTIPIMQSLKTDDSELKKEMIIRLLDLNMKQKGKYLREALQNKDTEVVHYAATSINALKDRYIRRISDLKSRLHMEKPELYVELVQIYQQYLESDLLTGEVKRLTTAEYADVLEQAIRLVPSQPHLYFQLAEARLLLGQYVQAEALGNTLLRRFPDYFGGYLIRLRLAYDKDNWAEIQETVRRLRDHVADNELPARWAAVIRQLEGV